MSRSTKRVRTVAIHARVTEAEKAAIADKAKAVGGISALFRICAMDYKPPKSKVDVQAHAQVLAALAALTGAVNKVGNNINQIAKEDNMGRDLRLNSLIAEWKEFKKIFDRDQLEYRQLHMRAVGLEPDRR